MAMLSRCKKEHIYAIGQGFTNCIIPSFIKHHFLGNPHVYSPYTPYQAEISQGRLEMLHNYQTIVENITNMDIAVASLIDNGQVGMDLLTLMKEKTRKPVIYIQQSINIPLLNCLQTRAAHQDVELRFFRNLEQLRLQNHNGLKDAGGVFVQTPDTLGSVINMEMLKEIKCINPKLLVACHSDLMYMVHYDPQVDCGIDFVFGNGGNMGVGLNYGGPQPAFLAAKKEHLRSLPGRIIGKTVDAHGRDSYRMALQTREQHIRREKATSNVCTSQVLLANMSATWCMHHGNVGLKNIAQHIHETATIFSQEMQRKNYSVQQSDFFDTITIDANNKDGVYQTLVDNGIYPYRTNHLHKLSFTFDETHDESTVERIMHYIPSPSTSYQYYTGNNNSVSIRSSEPLDHMGGEPIDEQSMMRYLHKLHKRDYSLMDGMIPLGSCTMKHTPHEAMASLMEPKWNIHPYVPHDNTPHKPMIENLSNHLCKLSGFDHVFYQSQSGAMGEYAGLTTIRNYLGSKDRTIIIMPRSAHGTNAASCVLAGYKPVYINETSEGMIDMDHFEELLETHKNHVAGLMITYPSTYGLYEPNARIINQRIHECGGQVYLDGANMNALVGMETPVADLGFDVCHFNLHKTFCIPHGGGGPGMGPIAVKEHLVDSLPSFSCTQQASSISTSPYGSGSLLVIPEHYVESQTDDDWVAHHAHLLETTKRVMKQLDGYYKIHHSSSPGRAHEFIIDTTPLKHTYKVTEVDICKRLMDYGFHGPTMSWPLAGGLMIEITETEPIEEVNRLVYALLKIHSEIVSKPELLRNAPHTQFDVANWSYDYTIGDACYPMKEQIDNKYWPTRNRVNDVYGDRNIMKK